MSNSHQYDPKLLELFKQEAETHLRYISQSLLEWEENISDLEKIQELMRAAHSLKGAARIIGLNDFTQIAHILEDCFVAAQKGSLVLKITDFDTILECINFLSQVTTLSNEDLINWPGNQREKLKSIENSIINITKNAPPPPAAEEPKISKTTTESAIFTLLKNEIIAQTNLIKTRLEQLKNKILSAQDIDPLLTATLSIKGTSNVAGQKSAENIALSIEKILTRIRNKEVELNSSTTEEILSYLKDLLNLSFVRSVDLPQTPISIPPSALGRIPRIKPKLQLDNNKPIDSTPTKPHEESKPEQSVRISATNLNHLMGLAAESLVETRRLEPLKQGLLQLKGLHRQLANLLELAQKLPNTLKLETIGQQASQNLSQYRTVLQNQLEIFDTFSKNNGILSTKLYNEVLTSRMRPFAEGVHAFPLLVRNLARSLNKNISLEIIGKETPVDRDILEKLEAPLNHLIRNACDHGIEGPQERLAAGKNEKGKIKINARHSGGMLILTISDDGYGIDKEKVKKNIISRNLLPKNIVATLRDEEIFDFLFLPGFSTSKDVTDISGRGVGLDVVRKAMQEISGKITVVSTKGLGTTFSLQLPITRSVLRALSVEINNEPYAIPLSRIDSILRIQQKDIHTLENRAYFHLEGNNIAMFSASQVLGLTPSNIHHENTISVVILREKENIYSLVVDKIISETELVVRPLDARLGKIPCVAATSITDEGIPVLILDVEDLLKYIERLLLGKTSIESFSPKEHKKKHIKKVLVVDDSLTVRETERRLLENAGYQVDLALDGVDGWNTLRETSFDLIITDIDMPRMNGFELISLIRNDPNLKNIPIVIISYKDRKEDRVNGMEAGANYYLTKSSFKDQTFVNAVKDLIGEPVQ